MQDKHNNCKYNFLEFVLKKTDNPTIKRKSKTK